MHVIFLDIDGVLLPFDSDMAPPFIFPEHTLQALSTIVEATNAVIVLSSTWRVAECFRNQIYQAFLHYGLVHPDSPLGTTITTFLDMTDPHYHANRQWEIYRWLQHYQRRHATQRIISWVALDDEELLEGDKNQIYKRHFEGHVVKTNSQTGLTMDDAMLAIQLFQQQQQQWQQRRNAQQQQQQEQQPPKHLSESTDSKATDTPLV